MRPFPLRPWPLAIVAGAFLVIYLPLLGLQVVPSFVAALPYLTLAHAVGLGTTHFFITLTVYFDRDNRSYFRSSARNRLIYFVAPLFILGSLAWIEASGARARYPAAVGYVFAAIRFFDFFHVGRQSFGMLQLWKRPAASALPAWSRHAENALFVGIALLQWLTFRSGGSFASAGPLHGAGALLLLALFVVLAFGYLRAGALLPLSYLSMQAFAGAGAIYDTRLYLVGLTLHYVEYHAMMYPRCFRAEPAAWGARGFTAVLRRHPSLLYALLFAIVIAFELRTVLGAGAPPNAQYFVRIFDGIFLLHYFLEAFLWKLRDPYYRRRLAPLYLDAPTAAPAVAKVSRRPELALGAVALVLLLIAWGQGILSRAAELSREAVRPMNMENHLRWGVRLAQEGQLERAEEHIDEALRIHPASKNAQGLKQWLVAARAERDRTREQSTLR